MKLHDSAYAGRKYGKWTVLGDAPDRVYYCKDGRVKRVPTLLCLCKCGVEKVLAQRELRIGKTTQCLKCYRKKLSITNLQKRNYNLMAQYGDWIVLYKFKSFYTNLYCKCRCKCGTEKYVSCGHLRGGSSRTCKSCSAKKEKDRR